MTERLSGGFGGGGGGGGLWGQGMESNMPRSTVGLRVIIKD